MKEGHNPEVSLEEGMRSVAVGLAAHRSIETGRGVEISEVMPAKYSKLQVMR
jgi:hypothetical protein